MRRTVKKFCPSRAQVSTTPGLRRISSILRHPLHWGVTRRSVAGGFAAGIFVGVIPLPTQMIMAAVLAALLRVNVPVAMAATWLTNPLTAAPIWAASYGIGQLLTGESGPSGAEFDFAATSIATLAADLANWLSMLGKPLLVGLPAFAAILAVTSYFGISYAWRLSVIKSHKKRKSSRLLRESGERRA